ncbi:lactonase family protein [Geothrix sp. PMB-07]|uniref:lactonase family protein n=1 Tax=Geothrix sp. PMB-07 TaxID=3068640 RepID=UPI002741CD91|nr:lactonase family protein [Geothrix sp. PMB-07]WLT32958.1 lactonase family protein [Geothrix sp. PMB-07]
MPSPFTCLLALASLASSSVCAGPKPELKAKSFLLFAGTYTQKESKGIYAWRFNAATGEVEALGLAAETVNPSFLVLHPNGKTLYAVNEVDSFQGQRSGAVSAFSVDRATGRLALLNQVASGGADPCHLALDRSGRHLFVANYTGGSVAVLPLEMDGRLKEASDLVQHVGTVVDPKRQGAPHAHAVTLSPDERFAFVTDLGLDRIFSYRFDATKGTLSPNEVPFARVAPGAGPRHFTFHPAGRLAYAINELQSSVTAFAFDPKLGALLELQTTSTLPAEAKGENDCAEILIHPNGKFLYGSNRGHDSLAVFGIGPGGLISPLEYVPTGGRTPRHFAMDPTGAYLFAENQASNNVVLFRVDAKTGRVTPTGKTFSVGAPVCLTFMSLD